MKIKMTVSMAGVDFVLSPGEVTERFSDKEALRLVKAGYAVAVAEPAVERAVKKTVREKRG